MKEGGKNAGLREGAWEGWQVENELTGKGIRKERNKNISSDDEVG